MKSYVRYFLEDLIMKGVFILSAVVLIIAAIIRFT